MYNVKAATEKAKMMKHAFVVLTILFFSLPVYASMPSAGDACPTGANTGSFVIGDTGSGNVGMLVCDSGGNYREFFTKNGTNPLTVDDLTVTGTCTGCGGGGGSGTWSNITTTSNWVNSSTPQCLVDGDRVFLKGEGQANGALSSGDVIGYLPAACRPVAKMIYISHFHARNAFTGAYLVGLRINTTDGAISVGESVTGFDTLAYDGIYFAQ